MFSFMANVTQSLAVVIASGSFHQPAHYQPLIDILQTKNFEVFCPRLPTSAILNASAAEVSNPVFNELPPPEGWPNGYDDVKTIQAEAERLAESGKKVLLAGHSYGGWVVQQAAIPELQLQTRSQNGKEGGVVGIFFMSAVILPEGYSIDSYSSPQGDATPLPPYITLHAHGKKGLVTPINSEEYYFNDLSSHDARHYTWLLRAQSVITDLQTNPSYLKLPMAYLKTEADKAVPVSVQDMIVESVTVQGGDVKTYTCPAGHDSPLSWGPGVVEYMVEFLRGL